MKIKTPNENFLDFYKNAVAEGEKYMLHGIPKDATLDVSSVHGTDKVCLTRLSDGSFRLGYPGIFRVNYKKFPFMVDESGFKEEMKRLGAPEEMVEEVINPKSSFSNND